MRRSTYIYINIHIYIHLYMLCFDLLTWPKIPFKVMHRMEVTPSNGSYERKLHDSYFRFMTIKNSISKIAWVIKWALNYYIAQSKQKSSSRVGVGGR